MKVLHVITGLNVGGAEAMLARLVERRSVTPDIRPQVASLMPPGFAGARIARTGIPIADLGMRGMASAPRAMLRLARLIRTQRPDCIMAWMHHAQLAASLAVQAACTATPVIWSVRHSLSGYAREKPATRMVLRAQARLSRAPAAILYNAREAAAQYRAFGFANARQMVIPNGFERTMPVPQADAAAALRARFGIAPGRLVIGMVARAHPMKDVPNLIAAFGLARARGLDAHLLLVGEGMDRLPDAMIAPLVAMGGACWTAAGQSGDVATWLGGLDMLVLPSAWGEGFPNIVGEAMARGVPCVVTDVGDAGWIVGETGHMVPPGDSAALAEAILKLAASGADGRAALGVRARARIAAEFDLDAIVRRYGDLVRDVAARGQAGRGARTPLTMKAVS